jgi:signal transduction histidine kinase
MAPHLAPAALNREIDMELLMHPQAATFPESAMLREQIAVLERVSQRRALVMASTGHDLRQPLQIILGALEHLDRRCTGEESRFWLSITQAQLRRLTSGLTDLAIASHADFEAAPVAVRPVSIAAALHAVIADLAPLARRKQLSLRVRPTAARVLSDPKTLHTILSNLVGNAIKYTQHGGVVIGDRTVDGQCAIDVVDSGIGMDAALTRRIASPFVQGDPRADGLGLGLWIVRRHCRELGHALEIASRPGMGSRFRVKLPYAPAHGGSYPIG